MKPLLGAAGQGLFCAQGVQVRAPALQPEQRLSLRGKGFYICHTGYGGSVALCCIFASSALPAALKPSTRRYGGVAG